MNDITYVGLDVHKTTVCVAIAEGGRGGEVREVATIVAIGFPALWVR
jgi:transposase